MHKEKLIELIISQLHQELSIALEAAKNAHLAAIDDQSVAETQYDTLAIEAAYLAEGQTRRVDEIKQAILAYQQIPLHTFNQDTAIALTAMVQLEQDSNNQHWYFIGPAAGGFKTTIEQRHYTVITPQSPFGQALIGKYLDDDVILILGTKTVSDYISNCY
ncbi:hypothetical protein [Thalassotalea sp. PLHSN55]|uniref:hypothetical protein n=1 Tax=Thalassotalea sp. PLHSN55 TaxID=3435888 RepID=UPI003F86643E